MRKEVEGVTERRMDLGGDAQERATEEAVEAYAKQLFNERWPGKTWEGHGSNRSYWRRSARTALEWEP